ncbi:MAG: cysteine desulfurase [Clostridia bacterium]|nr:cysteine desulfurase [Clostridia bacterium]
MQCYFDNSATTKPCAEAVEAMVAALTDNYGNPSSLHKVGDRANDLLEESRKTLAKALGCSSGEVYFTSGGTESNNIAIMGTAMALKRSGNRIVTSAVEHPSVEECMKRLEEQGFEVVRLPVDEFGCVRDEDIFDAVNKDTILVSIMAVNNEVGSIMPIKAAKAAIRKAGAPAYVHCDAVQAFGKIPVSPKALGADLITVSSHKVHGPKGQGALYVRKGLRILPYTLGGGQESNVRSGTQNMPGIAGFAAAVAAIGDIGENLAHVRELRDTFVKGVTEDDTAHLNSGENALPYVVNLSIPGVPSEVLRNYLSGRDIFVSTGSACSKGHRSTVLTQMGLEPATIDSAVRVSFSRFNTLEEVEEAIACFKEAAQTLKKRK